MSARVGRPPKFGGGGIGLHDRVRQEMFKVYYLGDHRISLGDSRLEFMDSHARRLFLEGLRVLNVFVES